MAISKPHVLVSRVPVPAGSDAEYKTTGTKMTSTWLDLSAARGQFFLVKFRVALICSIFCELKLSQDSHGTWGFTRRISGIVRDYFTGYKKVSRTSFIGHWKISLHKGYQQVII